MTASPRGPEMIPIANNCAVCAPTAHKHPTREYRILGCFGTWKTLCKIGKIFHRCRPTHAESDSRLFQKWSKSVQDKWPKGQVTLITKHVLAPWGETPGRFPPIFLCECAPWPATYIPDFVEIGPGLGKL